LDGVLPRASWAGPVCQAVRFPQQLRQGQPCARVGEPGLACCGCLVTASLQKRGKVYCPRLLLVSFLTLSWGRHVTLEVVVLDVWRGALWKRRRGGDTASLAHLPRCITEQRRRANAPQGMGREGDLCGVVQRSCKPSESGNAVGEQARTLGNTCCCLLRYTSFQLGAYVVLQGWHADMRPPPHSLGRCMSTPAAKLSAGACQPAAHTTPNIGAAQHPKGAPHPPGRTCLLFLGLSVVHCVYNNYCSRMAQHSIKGGCWAWGWHSSR